MLKSLRHALRLLGKAPGFTLVSICFAGHRDRRHLGDVQLWRCAAITPAAGSGAQPNRGDYHVQWGGLRQHRVYRTRITAIFATATAASTECWRLLTRRSGSNQMRRRCRRSRYGMYVSGNFFRVLGVQPVLGRAFLDTEDQAVGRDAVVVLGHDFWVHQMNGNPSVVGSTIWLNSVPFIVTGVAPEEFTGIDQFVKYAMFVPLAMSPRMGGTSVLEKRDVRWLTVKGHLKPGVTIAQAAADLSSIGARLEQMYPDTNRGHHVDVETEIQMRIGSRLRTRLW